jgi:hypothetical protein
VASKSDMHVVSTVSGSAMSRMGQRVSRDNRRAIAEDSLDSGVEFDFDSMKN